MFKKQESLYDIRDTYISHTVVEIAKFSLLSEKGVKCYRFFLPD